MRADTRSHPIPFTTSGGLFLRKTLTYKTQGSDEEEAEAETEAEERALTGMKQGTEQAAPRPGTNEPPTLARARIKRIGPRMRLTSGIGADTRCLWSLFSRPCCPQRWPQAY